MSTVNHLPRACAGPGKRPGIAAPGGRHLNSISGFSPQVQRYYAVQRNGASNCRGGRFSLEGELQRAGREGVGTPRLRRGARPELRGVAGGKRLRSRVERGLDYILDTFGPDKTQFVARA